MDAMFSFLISSVAKLPVFNKSNISNQPSNAKNKQSNHSENPEEECNQEIYCSLNGIKPRRDSKIGQQLHFVYDMKYDQWLRSYGLKPCWEVPKDTLEKSIWHGYRPNPSSISYCLKSMFYPSNDTLNVWTHFIPLLLLSWRTCNIYSSLDHPTEVITYPFWIFSFGCWIVFLFSCFAHLFNCLSATVQEFCYCFDYGAIIIFGFTSMISIQFYLCSKECFGDLTADNIPLPYLTYSIGIAATYITCRSRYPSCSYRYLCRFGPSALSYVLCTVPCLIRLVMTHLPFLLDDFDFASKEIEHCYLGDNYAYRYILQIACLSTGIAFVASRFPERWFPGRFDIVGHSHQWFHIFVALAIYSQHLMVEEALLHALELREARVLDGKRLGITIWTTLIPTLFFLLSVISVIYKVAKSVGQLVHNNREKSVQ